MRGRCLHDNFLLVQGTVRRLFNLRCPAVMLKLDITKAFDSVSWAFLFDVLHRLGFRRRWLAWVGALLGSATTCVMVNGVPGGVIVHRRGLCQSDPLSPMLFILVMDVLNGLFRKAESFGLFDLLASRGLHFFADDAVIFMRPVEHELRVTVALLQDFGCASGLHVHFQKTSAHLIRCGPENEALVGRLLGCVVGPFPCTYLGLPLGIRRPSAAQFRPLVDKVSKKLQTWSAPLLSSGGHLTLVRTTLCAMPIYAMMSLDLPVKTITDIERIRRGFLWRGRKEARGGHCLVAWESIYLPCELGGLGLPNLRLLNVTLRARWEWLGRTDPSRPWAEFRL